MSEDANDIISNLSQPNIVAVGSKLEYKKLSIIIEGKEFSSITSNSCFDAIIILLAHFRNTRNGRQLPIRVTALFNYLS